jgi:ribonuclease-3
MESKIQSLEDKINYTFKDKKLLINALTHKTYAFEAKEPLEYNERLEFLGDSILGFIAAEELYHTNKYFSEGELTRRRSIIVNNTFLAEKAKELDLGKYLRLGIGETKQEGAKNPTNLANTLEALTGAIYLDSNLETVREFIRNIIFGKNIEL